MKHSDNILIKIRKSNFSRYASHKLQHSKFRVRYSIFPLFLLSFFSCKTYQLDNLPNEQIIFGNGGGITGATTNYILLQNGQLFKTNSLQSDTTTLARIKPKIAKQYFEQITQLDWKKIEVNQPGNIYKFIAYQTAESAYRATWGASEYEAPEELKGIYDSLKKETVQE